MKLTMIKVKHYQLKNNLINYTILKRYHKWSYKISYVEISVTIAINLIFSKDNEDERVMMQKVLTKNSWLMTTQMKLPRKFLNHVMIDFRITIWKLDWKHQWQVSILSLIVLIYCITNVIKQIQIEVDNIQTSLTE